eukprot:CAMPEP_0196717554 /NCGR_PEP_ID=MMETSP1091-20130531/908_1 /TAXON_ID=302021 /ORGANISM="Rhodomonas sp., Strain CCMP768" /LENGTH=236 /DNA_ID=CAMNT_0042057921 /DNA_START=72 /DNA_END=782 /DNA_ORIENTATION=+
MPIAPHGPATSSNSAVEQTPPPAGSPEISPAKLGKRKLEMIESESWYPGKGVPCFPFGPKNELQMRTKQFKTSLLFLELQSQVKQAMVNKNKADEAERQLSLEVAQRHPIAPIAAPTHVEQSSVSATRKVDEMDMEYISAKKRKVAAAEMPAPLSASVLEAARKELPSGAVLAIETCLKCWREKKMGKDEVLFTIKTFASASPSLLHALEFKERPQFLGEAATQEQMRELSMLACA